VELPITDHERLEQIRKIKDIRSVFVRYKAMAAFNVCYVHEYKSEAGR